MTLENATCRYCGRPKSEHREDQSGRLVKCPIKRENDGERKLKGDY